MKIFVTGPSQLDQFLEEIWAARADFDKILNSNDQWLINITLEKYELYIQDHFEPDFPLHVSRPHSNMHQKMIIYSDSQLASDPIGYYSKDRLVTGERLESGFNEEYPNMT